MREKLAVLLSDDPTEKDEDENESDEDSAEDDGIPPYPTQDPLYFDEDELPASDCDSTSITIDLSLDKMQVGDCVEVWWKGDKCWYEGRITAVDLDSKQFDVFYFLDSKQLTHNEGEYRVRMAV